MRGLLADLALWLAGVTLRQSESALGTTDKRRYFDRSEFWHDVSAWLDGADTWSGLRRKRLLRSRLTIVNPDAPIRIQPKPPESGMGPGEAATWLLIWLAMPALTIVSFILMSPQAWMF